MQKYLIFGATGSVGSNLATQFSQANKEIHLIGRNDAELKKLSSNLEVINNVTFQEEKLLINRIFLIVKIQVLKYF